jgi:hypothetical protein
MPAWRGRVRRKALGIMRAHIGFGLLAVLLGLALSGAVLAQTAGGRSGWSSGTQIPKPRVSGAPGNALPPGVQCMKGYYFCSPCKGFGSIGRCCTNSQLCRCVDGNVGSCIGTGPSPPPLPNQPVGCLQQPGHFYCNPCPGFGAIARCCTVGQACRCVDGNVGSCF